MIATVLLLLVARPPVVVLAERGLPYYQANQAVTPRAVIAALGAAGLEAEAVGADRLPEALADPTVRVLVNVYGSTYPEPCGEAIVAFAARGGHLVSAGVPFCHPCRRETTGAVTAWRDQGHRPLEGLVCGAARWLPEGATATIPPDAPFALGPLEPEDAGIQPGAQVHWALDPASLPPGRTALPVLGVTDGQTTIYPVTAIDGPARVVWAGSGDCVDPRRPRQIAFAGRALALGAAWCLDRLDAAPAIAAAVPIPPATAPADIAISRLGPLPARPRCERVEQLLVCDIRGQPRPRQQALACLQGLANRGAARVYLVWDDHDLFWLEQLRKHGLIAAEEPVTIEALVEQLRPLAGGAVLADAASHQAAVSLAGARDLVYCDAETAAAWRIPLAHDLRGRFATRAAAEAWALEEVLPACAPSTVCHLHHDSAAMPYDYLVAGRVFCYWISGELDGNDAESDPPAELASAESLYRRLAAPAAMIGWWGCGDPFAGIGEYMGMSHASAHGLVTLGTEFSTNLSLLSQLQIPLRQHDPPPPPAREPVVYVAPAVLDSGNDPWYWQRYQRGVWEKPGWVDVPVSWCLGPLSARLQAPVLRWFFDGLPADHELFCAVSGLGYMHAPVYGEAVANRADLLAEYWRQTNDICGELGLTAAHLYVGAWGEGTVPRYDATLAAAEAGCPAVRTWLTDFGRPEHLTYADSVRTLPGGAPLVRCQTRWVPWGLSAELGLRQDEAEARALAREVREQTPAARPAYLIGLVLSWSASPEVVKMALGELGAEYRPVTVSQLGGLAR